MQFISSAYAQTAEATEAASKAASILLQYEILGVFCVFLLLALLVCCYVIRRQYLDNQALHNSNWARHEKAIVVIEASTAAMTETRTTNQVLISTVNVLGKAVEELSHESQKHDSDLRHSMGNAAARLDGHFAILEKISEKISGALERPRIEASR